MPNARHSTLSAALSAEFRFEVEIRELWIETLFDSDPAALMELLKQPA